ncbi:MAG: HD domain-containing phosphohydrolase, partial [Pirellulales bacterium]
RDEYEVMKRHTLIGGRLLAGSSSSVLQMAQQIALNHHERWDGTGYPCGVKGIAIPECARIVSVVDVYDALTHDRVYRPAFPQEQALELIHQGMGTQFDPVLLASFFTVIDELERIGQLHPDHPSGEAALAEAAGSAGTAVI